ALPVIDMAYNRLDPEGWLRQQADVDAPVVVAVDEHDSAVLGAERRQELVVEAGQGYTVLGFDDCEDIGVDLLYDLRRHPGGDLVHGLGLELHPSDEIATAIGNDLGAGCRAFHELAAILPENHEFVLVARAQSETIEGFEDSNLTRP